VSDETSVNKKLSETRVAETAVVLKFPEGGGGLKRGDNATSDSRTEDPRHQILIRGHTQSKLVFGTRKKAIAAGGA